MDDPRASDEDPPMRRFPMRQISMLVIALVGACTQDPAPAADPVEAPEADPAPQAGEPADAPSKAEPAPALEVGLVVVDPGKKPQPMRMSATVGTTARLVVTVRVNTRRGEGPAPLSPRARFVIDTKVTSASETGFRRELEIAAASVLLEDDVAPEAIDPMRALVDRFVGKKGEIVVDREGLASEATLDVPEDAAADTSAAILGYALRTALAEHLVSVPNADVGVGGKWDATRRTSVQGIETWRVARYVLEERDGDEIEVRAGLEFPAGELAGLPIGYPAMSSVQSIEGKGDVSARVHLGKATPIELHLSFALSFTGTDATGAVASGKIGVDATVDEDYLSQKDHRVALRGRFVQGALVQGKVAPGTKVWFEKRRIKVSETGDFLIGFDRDARHRALLSFAFGKDPAERHVVHVEQRTYETERIDGLPQELVKLDGKTRTELARADKRIDKIRAKVSDATDFLGGFVWPIKGKQKKSFALCAFPIVLWV